MRGLFIITRDNGADYDEVAGFLVCAGHEREARRLAANSHATEGELEWLDHRRSTCKKVGKALPGQALGVLLRDFHAG